MPPTDDLDPVALKERGLFIVSERLLSDLHWMARRYADGRMTYATGLFNDHTRALLAMGVNLNQCDETVFARDGMGRAYDGLTDDEAAPSHD